MLRRALHPQDNVVKYAVAAELLPISVVVRPRGPLKEEVSCCKMYNVTEAATTVKKVIPFQTGCGELSYHFLNHGCIFCSVVSDCKAQSICEAIFSCHFERGLGKVKSSMFINQLR